MDKEVFLIVFHKRSKVWELTGKNIFAESYSCMEFKKMEKEKFYFFENGKKFEDFETIEKLMYVDNWSLYLIQN